MEDKDLLSKSLFTCLTVSLVVLVTVVLIVINGFIVMNLWNWFMVDLGLPVISIGTAMGVALLVGVLTHQSAHSEDTRSQKDKAYGALYDSLLYPAIMFLLGYIIQAWIH